MKIIRLFIVLFVLLPMTRAQTKHAKNRIMVETTPWRNTFNIIDGWDWSLPPGTKPVPYSGVTMPWPKVNGRRPDLPGNEIIQISSSWRELEPEEGKYNFKPLIKKIKEAGKEWDYVLLHIKASVWEIKGFPDEPGTDYPDGWLEKQKAHNESAPRWLQKYNIPKVEAPPKMNIATPFQIINLDVFHEDYHNRYLRFVAAFGKSGIPQMKEVMAGYLHFASGSRGEEGFGLNRKETEVDKIRLRERLAAWAKAYGRSAYKLAFVDSRRKELIEYAYELGIGQRNGFVEMYMFCADNPALGQVLDKNGYLTVNEKLSPIAENRAFGDENEAYTALVIKRFGPIETFTHRYRESMLRALQMRRNFLWIESNRMNPPLAAYVSLELGRNVKNTPDIWCYLRESYIRGNEGGKQPVKNFERWLYQRDTPGHIAAPTAKVFVPDEMRFHHRDHKYDYTARKTNVETGNTAIGFAVDDRFLSGGSHKVAVKITYHDIGKARWALVYNNGQKIREISCWGNGTVRTVTWFLDDAVFNASDLAYDFEIKALEGDAVIKMVRIIKL